MKTSRRRMPAQKPGRSMQGYATPPEFLRAVKRYLGVGAFTIDLAASEGNSAARRYYTSAQNSLVQPWVFDGWSWLNPPFGDIGPWVRRALEASVDGGQIAMLVPASTGSNWWKTWVHDRASVLLLNGRITFVGCDGPYVKDCALLLYSKERLAGYEVWTWKPKPVTR